MREQLQHGPRPAVHAGKITAISNRNAKIINMTVAAIDKHHKKTVPQGYGDFKPNMTLTQSAFISIIALLKKAPVIANTKKC